MASLEILRQTNAVGVSIVILSLGTGRLSVLLFAGLLSGRFGRHPFVMLGMYCYMAFFFGVLQTNNIVIACVSGFLAGIANSFLDAGTYPSLTETLPCLPGVANILIKTFVSSGQFLLPLIISLLVWTELWFGQSFMIAAGVMLINVLFLYRCTFSPHPDCHLPAIKKTIRSTEYRRPITDLTSYTLYGYISMATFYLVSQWLSQYRQFVAGISYTMSIKLLNIYTVGSPLCVLIIAPLIRNAVHPTILLMLYTSISFIALFTVCLRPILYVVIIFAFVIGFTFVGGVMQIGLTLMIERFPYARGKATGIYYSAGSVAIFTIPLITVHLSQRSIADTMWFDTVIAAIDFLLALFIGLRNHEKTRHRSLKENVTPGG